MMRNTSKEVIRYDWNKVESMCFNIVPRVGHLPPEGSIQLRCYFNSDEIVELKDIVVGCEIQNIKQLNKKQFEPWDTKKV